MSNSSLVKYTKISPNKDSPRNHAIDRITPHCVVGQCSIETLGNIFAPTSRQASSNYGIGVDGRVGMYVEEKDCSWCSSNAANDHRAVTIECASDTTAPYAMKDAVYASLITLCTDICKRNGKTKLIWFGDKTKTLAYTPKSNEMIITVHRWFANKSCPGDWLYSRLDELAAEVTKRLGGTSTTTTTANITQATTGATAANYLVRITATVLNIRKGPGTNYAVTGQIKDKGVYTIVAESTGAGAKKWGKLKSGAGWIAIDFTAEVGSQSTTKTTTTKAIQKGDKVKVLKAVTYTGGSFKAYYDTYDVLQVNGDRVVIGIGKTITAAVNLSNLQVV